MLPAMLRSVSVFLIAVACALWADAVCAQDSPSDLVTRIDRLEETIRNLTGTVEQLQYRNQQLQQQVQQLQDQIQNGAGTRPQASAVPPPRPAAPYVPPAAPLPPPAPVIASAPPPPAPIEQGPPSGRRGDAFDPNVNPGAPGVPRPLGASTTATAPPPPVADAPIGTPGPRQPGAPLDLSSLSGPQGGA